MQCSSRGLLVLLLVLLLALWLLSLPCATILTVRSVRLPLQPPMALLLLLLPPHECIAVSSERALSAAAA
jgi:hypothetical protein